MFTMEHDVVGDERLLCGETIAILLAIWTCLIRLLIYLTQYWRHPKKKLQAWTKFPDASYLFEDPELPETIPTVIRTCSGMLLRRLWETISLWGIGRCNKRYQKILLPQLLRIVFILELEECQDRLYTGTLKMTLYFATLQTESQLWESTEDCVLRCMKTVSSLIYFHHPLSIQIPEHGESNRTDKVWNVSRDCEDSLLSLERIWKGKARHSKRRHQMVHPFHIQKEFSTLTSKVRILLSKSP